MKISLLRLILIFIFLMFWEAITRLGSISHIVIVPPSAIIVTIAKILICVSRVPGFYKNLSITVQEIGAAYALAASIGLFIGFAVGKSRLMGDAYEPILLAFYSIPSIILFPIIYLLLGTEMMPKIVFGVVVGIFSIIFNTAAGLRQVEASYIRLAQAVGCTPLETFLKVILPAAAPTILSGLKLGLGSTIIGVVVAELLVVNAGMGYLIDWASYNYYTEEVYALIILTMALGIIGYAIFTRMEEMWVK